MPKPTIIRDLYCFLGMMNPWNKCSLRLVEFYDSLHGYTNNRHTFLVEARTHSRFWNQQTGSWRIVVISGTVHWFWLKTSFHPLLWTSSGDEVHSSGWKLVFNQNQCTVPEITTILQDSTNSMRNLHQLQQTGNYKCPKSWNVTSCLNNLCCNQCKLDAVLL